MSNTKNNFKAYFIDFDGTLLDTRDANGKLSISERNLAAIQKANSEGKIIVPSTGRMGANASAFLSKLKSDYAVLGNGAQVWVKGKIVKEYKLSVKQVIKTFEILQKEKMVFKLDDQWVAYGAFNWKQKMISKNFGYVPKPHFGFEMHVEYVKIVAWGGSKKRMAEVAKKIMDKVAGVMVVSSTHGWTIEITHAEATKGKGNEYVINNYLNMSKQSTAHIGDTMNDSTTAGHVGALIAMKDADNNLKKMAQFIGPKHKNGGVARVLEGEFTFSNRR